MHIFTSSRKRRRCFGGGRSLAANWRLASVSFARLFTLKLKAIHFLTECYAFYTHTHTNKQIYMKKTASIHSKYSSAEESDDGQQSRQSCTNNPSPKITRRIHRRSKRRTSTSSILESDSMEEDSTEDDGAAENALLTKTAPSTQTSPAKTQHANSSLQQLERSIRKSNMLQRTITGISMAAAYFFINSLGHLVVCAFVGVLQFMVFKEVIGIAHRCTKEKQIQWFRTITWYFLMSTLFYLYGEEACLATNRLLFERGPSTLLSWLLVHHSFISFCFYACGFVGFVLTLRKGYYRFQFRQLAFTMLVLLMIFHQSKFIVANVLEGVIWFMIPTSLVTINDTAAYFSGKLFGRTPLIRVSPKKTVEGFVGGFVCSLLWAFFFVRHLLVYPSLRVPFAWGSSSSNSSNPNAAALEYLFLPTRIVPFGVGRLAFDFYPIQKHAMIMAVFASVIAPFGGFFASGFKRANKIKDFASSIPGHGGITDRMDCQFLMGVFSRLYLQSFLKQHPSVDHFYDVIIRKLAVADVQLLVDRLQAFVAAENVQLLR